MPTEELYLQDIVKSVDDVGRFLDGVEETKFLADEILQNAVLMKLVVIGDAAARISDEIRKRYPEIDWKSIIGFRNIAIHAYFPLNGVLFGKPQQTIWKFCANKYYKSYKMNFPILS